MNSDCTPKTRSVWLTLWVKIARQKNGRQYRHFKATWASQPMGCLLFKEAVYCTHNKWSHFVQRFLIPDSGTCVFRQSLTVVPVYLNKSAQSNLGRGPHRGAVAHICHKVPIGYNGVPQIRPQKYPYLWTDPQAPQPASSLDPSDLWCQIASRSDPPFFHNALDRLTHRPTDPPCESLVWL